MRPRIRQTHDISINV